ncbi:tumor necrosis factor receptor type 1-associated DEATH domain protein [Brienomyrus brachyistius]|uniref:tumor necrosis factor receptor type 1-associated DEATH domain protein n=1 Tax=Brienomyrus brachyistius TaxID=42636 RepID=UPI0020B2D4BC|nr:tumor necrosis factor receptor type 1-associated DEATH domain protein [Brienomyrus brachyistius]XP_048829636.1 tumor necrosis factor receptor type 1-associated DEATH domain protein [Brienomyrus brachyistius]XP_048829637.1 tumor necrosis factor receptor type 1-associated DEATH domain protein [Brienomyrus brachyistius]XP_048829638.1 tumor necrosis factor receptor type 1-associated DEATH domain protein [Brienomyrus brachyistius]
METPEGKKMSSKSADGVWLGCAFLFVKSVCPKVNLPALYKDPQKKYDLFKVVKLTLSDTAGGLQGYEILKLHDADPLLGIELKFMNKATCRQFLESYATAAVSQAFTQHTLRIFSVSEDFTVETQLKAGENVLDLYLTNQDLCLSYIHSLQPVRLRDDEVSQLEKQLLNLTIGDRDSSNSFPSLVSRPEAPAVPGNCFTFQKKLFVDRQLTPADHQRFATNIGRDWKQVGRALQKTCRALKGPTIDNLAFEYEREGIYEQAYQLLSRFIQAEGRNAKLGRLVKALEETKLVGIAEIMLEIQPRE